MQQVILIFFGWVLGVFSSMILENRKRKQTKEDYEGILFTELNLVYPEIVGIYYKITKGTGQLNKENLEWTHNIISKKNSKSLDTIDDEIIEYLKYNDKEMKLLNEEHHNSHTLVIMKLNLSFLKENISLFSLLDKEVRFSAINIRTKINYLNDIIDEVNYFYRTSFVPGVTESTYNIAKSNIKKCYILIEDLCKSTSEMIVSINEKRKKIY
jgi:hypothetical protein